MDIYRPLYDIEPSSAEYWRLQVLKEINTLENLKVEVLAKRAGSDDVLLRIDGDKYTIVHLTFSTNVRIGKLDYFDSFDSIKQNWQSFFGYDVQHEDYEAQ